MIIIEAKKNPEEKNLELQKQSLYKKAEELQLRIKEQQKQEKIYLSKNKGLLFKILKEVEQSHKESQKTLQEIHDFLKSVQTLFGEN